MGCDDKALLSDLSDLTSIPRCDFKGPFAISLTIFITQAAIALTTVYCFDPLEALRAN